MEGGGKRGDKQQLYQWLAGQAAALCQASHQGNINKGRVTNVQ